MPNSLVTSHDGTFRQLSCHPRQWRSHFCATPCACFVIRVHCAPCRSAARPRRGHPVCNPAPAPERSNNGPTTLREEAHERRDYALANPARRSLRGGHPAQQRTPTAGKQLRTNWFRSAADAGDAVASRAAEEQEEPGAPLCESGPGQSDLGLCGCERSGAFGLNRSRTRACCLFCARVCVSLDQQPGVSGSLDHPLARFCLFWRFW